MSVLFDDSSNWPRRLLHIPTMTSFPWTAGDRYGGRVRPTYYVLSYTWGRWRLESHELPHVQALTIWGTTWSIPRVHPDHFSAYQLETTLRGLSDLSLDEDMAPGKLVRPVDSFIAGYGTYL